MSAQPYPDFSTKASLAPTKQEQEAIVLLKDQDAAIVCAYLRVARALGGASHRGNGQSVLTDDEVHAIFALSGHEDAIVWSWLANAQGASTSAIPELYARTNGSSRSQSLRKFLERCRRY